MNSRLFLAAIAAITSMLLSAAAAQQPPGGIPTGNPRDRATEDKIRSDELERVKREAEKPENKDSAPRFPSIKEDFEQIQIINNDVLQTDVASSPLEYKRLSAAADEIRQRAVRLKANMFSAPAEKQPAAKGSDEKEPQTAEPQDVKSLLAALDKAIHSFVSNPMFTNLNVVNAQKSVQARRDLEQVIKLSTRLRKEADKLRKASGN